MEGNDLIIYRNSDGNIIVDAIYKDETLWLTQKGIEDVYFKLVEYYRKIDVGVVNDYERFY